MIVSEVFGLDEALSTVIEKVELNLSYEQAAPARLALLQDVLERHKGTIPAFINLRMPECRIVMALENFPLQPSADLVHDVNNIYNSGRLVEFVASEKIIESKPENGRRYSQQKGKNQKIT